MKKFIKSFLKIVLGIDIELQKAVCISDIYPFREKEKVKFKRSGICTYIVISSQRRGVYDFLKDSDLMCYFKIKERKERKSLYLLGIIRAIIGKYVNEEDDINKHTKDQLYVRQIKLSDHFLDFDPFDNPFGGGTMMFYPKITLKILNKYKYGVYERFDDHKNTCYSFNNSKHELQKFCDERNALRLKELQARRKGTP